MATALLSRRNEPRKASRVSSGLENGVPLLDNGYRLAQADFHRSDFRLHKPSASGVYSSGVFPGLRLDAAAMLTRDLKRVMAQLRKGLASAEYRQFVRRLAAQ